MNRKYLIILLVLVTILLAGCSMATIDQMYCLPKRSEQSLNLQTAIDNAMTNLEYAAPISGEHQQPVQLVDLDGDGIDECLVFAKDNGEKPIKVLVFRCIDEEYVLTDTLEGSGTAIEQVQYIPFSGKKGVDMVIGKQVSEQVIRPVSVYTMTAGKMHQLFTTHYSSFVCADMDEDAQSEIMILRPQEDASKNGVVELYSMSKGVVERSQEVTMSRPADSVKKIMISSLNDGIPAVYVASDVDGSAIITDVYAIVDDALKNVSLSNESGTSVQTLRNYYVYADDIDSDGVLELPSLIPLPVTSNSSNEEQYLIRWYSMNSDGSVEDKLHTYHSFTGGWYLELDKEIVNNVRVAQMGNSYEFSVLDKNKEALKLLTLYVFTGQEREELAVADNRFVLYRSESTVYAAHLDVASASYNITQESLKNSFHLITQNAANG